jgi:2-(1,2-epoxy-1,2-dihydrophenyl)acetyl-CoA isomerase
MGLRPGGNAAVDEVLHVRIADGYCVLTLNRPARLNALTAELLRALHAGLTRCGDDGTIRAVLLTGAGRAFCAGQDLSGRDPRKIEWPPKLDELQKELFHPVILAMKALPKPVVIAVNGAAAGAGLSLALAGDIVIAARTAQFIPSFAKVGLSVDAGGGWHLTRALGPARAKALLMTGQPLSAAAAESAGLIWKCVDDAALMPEAEALVSQLAKGPTRAYAAMKKAVAAAESATCLEDYLCEEARLQGEAGQTGDYREGVLAFLEKRPPRFNGT